MNDEKATVILFFKSQNRKIDIEIPLDITFDELAKGLGQAFKITPPDHISAENPIVLLKGSRNLRQFNIRNGSILIV